MALNQNEKMEKQWIKTKQKERARFVLDVLFYTTSICAFLIIIIYYTTKLLK